jgi:L-ascorbate metabolism protein UlaG (beta-lactamase superfamily)
MPLANIKLRRTAAIALAACLLVPLPLTTAAAAGDGKIMVQWFGQSAFKITSVTGKVIMVDPFLTKNPKTPPEHKDLAALGKVDLVLVTHAHGDHVGDGPALAKLHQAPLYGPAGLNDTLVALEELPKELSPRFNKGGAIQPLGEGIRITMTRAEHSSEYRWTNPHTGQQEIHVGGEPAGFIIELENGFRIYHMGDTGLFGDLGFIAGYYRPDLVLIPIGGHFVMDPKDAAYATREYLKPRYAIPMHYGTNPMLKGTPEEYRQALGETSTQVLSLKPGESVRF